MHDQSIEDAPEDHMSEEDRDNAVLNRMFFDTEHYPWSIEELGREIRDSLAAVDSVGRLVEAGLLHRAGQYIWPTRSARRAREIGLGEV